MVPFVSFVTLALAAMVVASPFKRAPSLAVPLSTGVASINFVDENSLVTPVDNTASSRESGGESNLEKRDVVSCSDTTQDSFMSNAYSEALSLANGAINYIDTGGATDGLFVKYFGAGHSDHPNQQMAIFVDLALVNDVTLFCNDPYSTCTRNNNIGLFGAYAQDRNVYSCPSFSNQVDMGQLCSWSSLDSGQLRGATILQAITSSLDYTLGQGSCDDAVQRAVTDPSAAARSGDNYRCFAMQVHIKTNC